VTATCSNISVQSSNLSRQLIVNGICFLF